MATIYRLVTQLAVDPAPMEAGFARGLQLIQNYANRAQAALANIAPEANTTTAAENGAVVAGTFVGALEKEFRAQEGNLKEAFARGTLSKEAWKEKGEENSKAFNDSLLGGIQGIRAEAAANGTIVPEEIFTGLQSQLKEEGVKAADEFANSFTTIGEKFRSLGRDLTQTGRELSIALTVPITAATIAAVASAETFSHAIEEISNTTGKVGPELEAMAGSLHRLFDDLPSSADDIARALEIISTQTGATGTDLDHLATQVLNLSRLTGTDLRGNVESTQHAFKDFGVAVSEQEAGLNTLFRTSQLTGSTVEQLASTISRFAPTLRGIGLSFEQSSALVGQFQKNGLEADSVLTALQTSLARFAERGTDATTAFTVILRDIKSAATEADAVDLAGRIFGPRQAQRLADAIRSGKLDIQALTELVRASGRDINTAAEKTDEFGNAMNELRHHLTDASAVLGESFERAVIAISPALIAIADATAHTAEAFDKLRPGLQATIGGLIAFAAALGPLVLVLGGLSKFIGAASLSIGILKAGLSGFSLGPLIAGATGAGEAMTGAAAAAATLAASLRLLLIGVGIGAVLVGISIIFNAITEETRKANEELDKFKDKIAGLSDVQLKVQDDTISAQIAANVNDIERLKKAYADAQAAGNLTPKFVASNKAAIDEDIRQNGILERELNRIADAQAKNAEAAKSATVEMDAFTKSVNSLITEGGQGPIKIDAVGHITASVDVLQAHIKSLQEVIAHPAELGPIDIKVAKEALEQLQHALNETNAAGKGIRPTFDQESNGVKNLADSVGTLVSRIQDLGPTPLQQLGRADFNKGALDFLQRVNAELKALPEWAIADRRALEAMQKSLESLTQVQLTSNLSGSNDIKVSVTGVITKLVPDVSPASSANFIELTAIGLGRIKDAAERAAAASANLQNAIDSHATQDAIIAAQNAVTQSYARLRTEEIDFRAQVDKTNKSLTDRNTAKAAINPVVTGAGALPAEVKPEAKSADTAEFMKQLQSQIDALPGLSINVVPVQEFKDLHDFATEIAKQVQSAQLQALSGNAGAARAAQQKLLNDFSRQVQQVAKDTGSTGLAQQSVAFQRIAAEAARAGVPIADILKHMKELTTLGRLTTIADAFKAAADAAFGANSAIAGIAGGIDQAIEGAGKLKDAFDAIKHGGSLSDNLGSLLEGFTQGITGAISAVKAVVSGITSLFGKSQLEIEHDKILRDNNAALAKLTVSVDRSAGTPGRLDEIIRAVAASQNNAPDQSFIQKFFSGGVENQKDFTNFLHSIGLTFAEVEQEAKALGITLKDSKGNLVGLDAFGKALQKEADFLTRLGSDFGAQQARIAADNAVAGRVTETAAQTLQDQLLAIARTAPDIGATLTAAFAQGPDALRKALQSLVASIENGSITLDQLHGFKDVSELLSAITSAADGLNKLGDTAAGVTETLVGVPLGFKKALAEFNATAAQSSFLPPPTPPAPKPTDTVPTRPPDAGTLQDLVKQLVGALKGVQPTPVPVLPATPGPAADVAAAGGALSDVRDTLKGLTAVSDGTTKSVSDVRDALAGLPVSVSGSTTSLADLSQQLAVGLPGAAANATAAIQTIISGLSNAVVNVPAPVFHVERLPTVTLASPEVRVEALQPITLAPPSITFGQFPALSIEAPPLSVAPFPSITLAAPPVTVLPFAPVQLAAPSVTVADISPIRAAPPIVTLASALADVRAEPPVVTLARAIAPVVVEPPHATVAAYKSNVALSPPPVSVRQFPTVMLAAPSISVAKPGTVTMAAPSFHVQPFERIRLDGPPVSIQPYKPVTLEPPKVRIEPLAPIRQPLAPISHVDPVATLPDTKADVDTPGERRLLAQLVDLLTSSALAPVATGDTIFTGDINIDAQKQTRKEIFEAAKAEAQAISRATTGSTKNIVSAFQK